MTFYIPIKKNSHVWRRHKLGKAAKSGSFFGAYDPRAERDLYRATPPVTRDLIFFSLIQNDQSVSSLDTTNTGHQYSNPDPHRKDIKP